MNSEHPVFRDIEIDALKSEHLRKKLADFKPVNSPEKLRPFLSAIEFYLKGMSASGTRAEFLDKLASPIATLEPCDLEQSFGGRSRFGDLKTQENTLPTTTVGPARSRAPENIQLKLRFHKV
jgi:hypothetical protein